MITNFVVGKTYTYSGPHLKCWRTRGKTGFVTEVHLLKCVKASNGYALFQGQTPTGKSGRNGMWNYTKLLGNFTCLEDNASVKSDVVTTAVKSDTIVDVSAIRSQVRRDFLSSF